MNEEERKRKMDDDVDTSLASERIDLGFSLPEGSLDRKQGYIYIYIFDLSLSTYYVG